VHFAGGNRYSFQFLAPYLKDFEFIPLELPGRGKRVGEPLLKDFDLAALDLYNQVIEKLHRQDFLIYGHSMGAYLALRIANMLEKAGRPPACLLVSGNAGPGTRERQDIHMLDPEDFIVELRKMGGMPQEFTDNHE